MGYKSKAVSMLFLAGILCSAADVAKKQATPQVEPAAPSLALSPGVVEVKAQPGASSTHVMTMSNLTGVKFRFVLEAFDVITVDGKRLFVPAGETAGGIAR